MHDTHRTLVFGPFQYDEALGELRTKGQRVALEPTPLRLLAYLIEHRNRVVSKEELLTQIWPDATVGDTALSSAISHVRQALGDSGSRQRMIVTLRRRGFRFIAEVDERLVRSTPGPARPGDHPHRISPPLLEGERKQVTTLFADVEGSMELIEGMDPEAAHRIVGPVLRLMTDAVQQYEGHVVQSSAGGIFALFGAPIAHEDHVHRALHAALLMQKQAAKRDEERRAAGAEPVRIRVGINSGDVVIRSIDDAGRHNKYTSIGPSTALAARMQALAEPGSILVSEQTRRLAEGYFTFKARGDTKLDGIAEPVGIFEVTGATRKRTRLEMAVKRGLLPFIGRQRELEQLRIALDSATQGHGQVVAVVGEAGVGKSRLLYEFKAALPPDYLLMETHSVSHGATSAYLPLIELLKSYFGITNQDNDTKKRSKSRERLLALERKLEDTLPYLFGVLDIAEATSSLEQMDPQIRRQRTVDAVKALLIRESLNQPLVLVFEDLHWIDAETQAFLDLLTDSLATTQILLLVTYRPEYRHDWSSRSHYSHLRIDPLGSAEALEMLGTLLGDGVPARTEPLIQRILQRTDGNPFFIEEVVRMLADEEVLSGRPGHYRLERTPRELHIPATVQAVLASRIDRLPAGGKDLLQTLAVIGQTFSAALVQRVLAQAGHGLDIGVLSDLKAAEFIFEQPAFPQPEYRFKHTLTHEVAYGAVLGNRRRAIHESAARAIEDLYRSELAGHYCELARHYSCSDNKAKAVQYLRLAGQQALQRSAYDEAIVQFTKVIELIETLPETTERDAQELALQTTLGAALGVARGWAAAEVEQTYGRALELCERTVETEQLCLTLGGLSVMHFIRGNLPSALELGARYLDLAKDSEDTGLAIGAHQIVGATQHFLGEFSVALNHHEQVIAVYDAKRHHRLRVLHGGFDQGVACLALAGAGLVLLGYPDQALARVQEALRLAENLAHPFSRGFALIWASSVLRERREWQAVRDRTDELIALSSEHGFPFWLERGRLYSGLALAEQGQLEGGISQIRAVLDVIQTSGANLGRPWYLSMLARLHSEAGHSSEGLACIAEAMDLMEETGARAGEAEIHRVKGELLLLESKDDQAERCFEKAIEVARDQQAKWPELVASTTLARLWQRQERTGEARTFLGEIYGWFTEGFDTKNLKDAKTLLDELG
ncbi:MAG: AAA family ATPase [Candidatus Binatia bacterium]